MADRGRPNPWDALLPDGQSPCRCEQRGMPGGAHPNQRRQIKAGRRFGGLAEDGPQRLHLCCVLTLNRKRCWNDQVDLGRPDPGVCDRGLHRPPDAVIDAGVSPDQVSYINAHGTSTPANDSTETAAIKRALGEDAARNAAISSTKSMTGHLLGGSGGIEAVAAAMAIANDKVPPTINLENPELEDENALCDLDYVPNEARAMPVNVALSNSFGFGGHNVTLVFKKLEV